MGADIGAEDGSNRGRAGARLVRGYGLLRCGLNVVESSSAVSFVPSHPASRDVCDGRVVARASEAVASSSWCLPRSVMVEIFGAT